MNETRRRFLTAAAAGLAASTAFGAASTAFGAGLPTPPPARARTYRTALVGCGWWGNNILHEAMAAEQSKVVGLCDVDPGALETTAEHVKDQSGDEPRKYGDFRELLEREKPEVVVIATPDHWHALVTIAALQSGAHVFVEKPTGHTIRESRAMLNAARAAQRVVQVGLHRRIGPHHVSGIRFLKEGKAGEIGLVRVFVSGRGGKEAPSTNALPPKGMDWDLYCGPAPLRPFNRKIHPGGWRGFLDFANGTLGDWGVHWLDQVLMWTDEKYPRRVFSSGGRPIAGAPVLTPKEQTTDAPDSQVAVYEFESFTAVWEHHHFADNNAEKHKLGCYFYGTKGTFHMGWRDGWTFYPANAKEPTVHEKAQLQEPDGHNLKLLWADFLNRIAAGRAPVAGIELAHRSTCLSLLGMLALKHGRSIQWDGAREQIVGDDAANRLLSREYRQPWKYPRE
jgi:predicted dehydrogenase